MPVDVGQKLLECYDSWARSEMDAPLGEIAVRKFEHELKEAIAGVVARLGLRRLPLQQTGPPDGHPTGESPAKNRFTDSDGQA